MNLKAAFLALALSLPFAAASATVSSVASADPLPAAQAAKPGAKGARVGEGKRGEHGKGKHGKGAHRRGEHRKGERGKGAHRRGEHGKGAHVKGPRADGASRPQGRPAGR